MRLLLNFMMGDNPATAVIEAVSWDAHGPEVRLLDDTMTIRGYFGTVFSMVIMDSEPADTEEKDETPACATCRDLIGDWVRSHCMCSGKIINTVDRLCLGCEDAPICYWASAQYDLKGRS